MRHSRKTKEIEWTFTVEELKHYQHAQAKCPCDGCRRINEFYHHTPEVLEWEDKLEKDLAKWKPSKEVKKLDRVDNRNPEMGRNHDRNKLRTKRNLKAKDEDRDKT